MSLKVNTTLTCFVQLTLHRVFVVFWERVKLISQSSNYQQQLHPWCIIRLLPNLQRLTVARCRRRSDAEAHLRLLRQQIVSGDFIIVFDPFIQKSHERANSS